MRDQARERATRIATTAAAYVATGWVGLRLALPPGLATAVWPPSGIAVAAAWTWGPSVWPGIAAGSLALNFFMLFGMGAGRAAIIAAAISAGSTIQALVGARGLRALLGTARAFAGPREVFAFSALVMGCCVIAPTFGVAAMWAGGLAGGGTLAANWVTWWLGDVVGILVLVPAFWPGEAGGPLTRRKIVHAAWLGSVLLALILFMFWGGSWVARARLPMAYLLLPVVALGSLHFGQSGACAIVAAAAIAAITGTASGLGPFAAAPGPLPMLLMQGFVGVLALTGLLLAAATEQERRVQRDLERLVAERTAELSAANERMLARGEELSRSNADLEQFAYACSHDLKEPLRKITGFVELFARRYQGKLDAQADEMIGFVVSGVSRMQRLIGDLLEYSRVGHQDQALEDVDLAEVLALVTADFSDKVQALGARVAVGSLPRMRGYRGQLRQVFENLIGNGLKFHGAAAPEISVTAERQSAEWVIRVADNGIGIAPEYLERVFGLFRRLHPPDAFPGTGIGLALCKKIVQRHGGRIWVESAPGRGSTFCFTLPAK